jgi:hypothetical protein
MATWLIQMPLTSRVGGFAGTAAKEQGEQRDNNERFAHGEILLKRSRRSMKTLRRMYYSITRIASISTCEPFGRAATPMAARAG